MGRLHWGGGLRLAVLSAVGPGPGTRPRNTVYVLMALAVGSRRTLA